MTTTVLIADEDDELAELYQRYLTRHGYRTLTASGGIECLSLVRCESPSVLVASVDLLWGGADGLVECLREEPHRQRIPSVILVGCTAEENVAELRQQSLVFRYLSKPFLMSHLLDCIRAVESEDCTDLWQTPTHHRHEFAGTASAR